MGKNGNYKANEQDIKATVSDFASFCRFTDERKPVLSKRMEVLGKNDLFELNAHLELRKNVAAPHYLQESYPVIDLMFILAVLGELYVKAGDNKGNVYLNSTIRKAEFDVLNSFEKYCFLFETFWTQYDFMKIFRFGWGDEPLHEIVQTIAQSRPGQELLKGAFSKRTGYDPIFSYDSVIIHYFSFFGLCTFIPNTDENKKLTKWDDLIKVVIPSEFGVNFCKILMEQKVKNWNIPWLEIYGSLDKEENENIPLFKFLEPIFPEGALSKTVEVEAEPIKTVEGSYIFKVSLERNVWRKIRISYDHSLDQLHSAIQKAFNFDSDHLYSFFMDGRKYSENAYHSPYCDEGPYADEAIIGELALYEKKKFLYLFDYGDSWTFAVQLLMINADEIPPGQPEIIELKGEAPEQYR
ncbi:MAG: plasmid pRiA4b ORF-3 family protein [Mangrovibacterium sp.]|nr:plasmid pRiA4b ORF-3 family protein [Mangrovibacterium sp.]